ncbi:oxalate:formate antiporter [candidate division WOR-1 bacterium RIFOXYA12_FULL_43_27]|uniref:Oxalate:formate antiporter n=1 Tax=candidate division WOR-1 bacterium RIFOXYC2_FULL_46_14 TaxID=1802587 RepID=A0A1F4U5J1_UNCSA|nr:MAG: oxalate:formate antiporter [candidate division WOR-1 bacterium RIFOXYA12_FULL_43_27]OGC20360.1 MAG: oxalate:formate antiporter [candidate division WOR-1 bacterium RIFOXYB2_FULL_46_45]OGC31903.1 MAG: oxalate:formate antiporter [candidate division WOR-1 bacterium RIFOXYA2_FULL_46_56]OGC40206.1 MAG: oxalate:formate antiporter [candidate division WOR-1 bacterium RIFOXYC2_FULL_46_14]
MGKTTNRWGIALAGIIMQLLLGTVYGWSVFKKPLMESHGWTGVQVGLAFTIAIFCLGMAAALGGKFVDRAGARKVATTAAILFGFGTLLAGYANSIGNLWLLWLGYGVIAGIGNGLGYITPIAVLIRWFPDKRGLITGLAVMGFGFGSALIGQFVPLLLPSIGITSTFYVLGIIYLIILGLAAQFLNNPPEGWSPPVSAGAKINSSAAVNSLCLRDALGTFQFYILWLVLFINVTAGIALISNMSPMAQAQLGVTAVVAGTLVFTASIFNGLGRVFWASLSDKIGRKNVFLIMLSSQIPVFFLLPQASNIWIFGAMCCYILSCLGGGFATMPSFAVDTFGPKNCGNIYGKVLLAWSLAGVVGPLLMEYVLKVTSSFSMALIIASGLLAVGVFLVSLYKKPEAVAA